MLEVPFAPVGLSPSFRGMGPDMAENQEQEAMRTRLAAIASSRSRPPCDTVEIQRRLNAFYLRESASPSDFMQVPVAEEYAQILNIEEAWNAHEEGLIDRDGIPDSVAAFEAWYAKLFRVHRAAVAPFFEYLAHRATVDELAFYISLEEQVDGRFDDVIALAQLGMFGDMKLALAENFWDEMGLGKVDEMHTNLFRRSADHMKTVSKAGIADSTIPAEAYKNGNLLLMYALRRRYAPRLLGALTILEHTAPYRFSMTVKGMRRLKIAEEAVYYHEMHIGVDANHGKQMFNRVLLPLAAQAPPTLREICIGCLIRFRIATAYYDSISTIFQNRLTSEVTQ